MSAIAKRLRDSAYGVADPRPVMLKAAEIIERLEKENARLSDLVYLPKIASDDEQVSYSDYAGRLLQRNAALTAALEHAFNTINIEWLRCIRHETTTETGAQLSVETLRTHLAAALAALGEPREEK